MKRRSQWRRRGDPRWAPDAHAERRARIMVFAPSPLLTVTIEHGPDQPEVHLHAGGQGFWVAHLAATLGAEVVFCCALGGEPGRVLRALIEADPLVLGAADADTPNGVYVHDRRSGERVEIVSSYSRPLARHASDELYGITLAAGLDADLTLITGCQPSDVVETDLYRRLVGDLRGNGRTVIADLRGPHLRATLEGGVELLRLSDEQLVRDHYAARDALPDLVAGAHRLHAAGAQNVLVSRAAAPALLIGDRAFPDELQLVAPEFETVDHRGTGDSMFAATAVGLARGMDLIDALRIGMAAGALNATRRGLGTGTRREIERLAAHVAVRPLQTAPADHADA